MSKNQEKKPKQLIPFWLKISGIGAIAAGGLLGLNNAENPVREVPRTESLAPSNFGVTGPEITTEAGKDKIYKGLKIAFRKELAKFNFNRGGHFRDAPAVVDGTDGDPSNDLRIKGLQDEDAAWLLNPVVNPNTVNDPNGTWLFAYVGKEPGYINEEAATQVNALETVISNPKVDTNLSFAIVEEVHADGLLVRQYDEDGRQVGDTFAVGVMKIGDKNLKP